MEELIEFTLMIKQLDDNELIQFLSQSLKNHGASLFGNLFFNYFMHPYHRTEIQDHTQCLMDIINAREEQPNRTTSHARIDHLPSTLISECASYLPLNEYVLFSQTNRQIFVSSHKPFKLYELSSSAFHKCPQTTSMHKFKSVKSISFDINEKISTTNQSIWKHSSFDKVVLFNTGKGDTQWTSFFNKNIINLNTINKLCLSDFGGPDWCYSSRAFSKLFCGFVSIKHLSFKEIYLSNLSFTTKDDGMRWISKCVPKLTSFCVRMSIYNANTLYLATAIVNTIGHQLESLTFPPEHASDLHCKFSNLKELEFEYCAASNPTCLAPFRNVTTLQSMSIGFVSDNMIMLKACIDFMLKKQTSIRQIKIASDIKYLKCIFEHIQKALFDSHYQGVKRDSLFIFIESSDGLPDIDIAFEMFKLANTLKNVQINDFMIRINLNGRTEPKTIKQLASEFDKMKDDYLVYCYQCYGDVFTVGNKGCKINGLKWKHLFQ